MTGFVVDASVAVKWFLDENESPEARALLGGAPDLLAPDLLYGETANVLWKRIRRGEMTLPQAQSVQRGLLEVPIDVFRSAALTASALDLASETDTTVYDCLYLTLALRSGFPLVTADQRLCRKLDGSAYASTILPLANLRPEAGA